MKGSLSRRLIKFESDYSKQAAIVMARRWGPWVENREVDPVLWDQGLSWRRRSVRETERAMQAARAEAIVDRSCEVYSRSIG